MMLSARFLIILDYRWLLKITLSGCVHVLSRKDKKPGVTPSNAAAKSVSKTAAVKTKKKVCNLFFLPL